MPRILALLVVLSASLSVTAQTIAPGITTGPEQRVAPARIGAAELSSQWLLGLVPHEDGVLAVASHTAIPQTVATPRRLATVRINRSGRVDPVVNLTDTRAAGLSTVAATTTLRAVAWWSDDGNVRVSMLRSNGTSSLDSRAIAQSGNPGPIDTSCNASRCLVAWGFDERHAVIIDADANVVRTLELPIRAQLISTDPNGFLCLRNVNFDETRLLRISSDGTQLFEVALSSANTIVAADFDGDAYTVAFVDFRDSAHPTVVQRLSLDGTLSDRRVIFTPRAEDDYSGLAIAWSGSQHLVGISSGRAAQIVFEGVVSESDLYGIRLDSNRVPIGDAFRISIAPGVNWLPRIVANGDGFEVAWMSARSGFDTFISVASRVDAGGHPSAPAPLFSGPIPQTPLSIASTGSQSLAVWSEYDRVAARMQLRAMRLSASNTPLDAQPLVLADTGNLLSASSAALGSDYLVVWSAYDESNHRVIRGAIVRSNGSIEQLTITGIDTLAPRVASDGNSWLVVGAGVGGSVRAVRIAASGLILTPQPVILMQQIATAAGTDVASNGNGFVATAVVEPYPGCTDECSGTFGIPIKADGTLAAPPRRFNGGVSVEVRIASNGRDYLAAGILAGGRRIRLVRLLGNGFFQSAYDLPRADYASRIALTRLGSGWLVSWIEQGGAAVVTDASGVPLTQPVVTQPFTALATKDDKAVIALYGVNVDNALAAMVRDFTGTPMTIGRMRVATR
jgi:hypothetical protein